MFGSEDNSREVWVYRGIDIGRYHLTFAIGDMYGSDYLNVANTLNGWLGEFKRKMWSGMSLEDMVELVKVFMEEKYKNGDFDGWMAVIRDNITGIELRVV